MQVRTENWIKSLYQRSWEMELIICGFAIFLLLQVSSELAIAHEWLNYHIDAENSVMYPLVTTTLMISEIAVKTLLVFLIINLVFRAYWIALIGMLSSIKKPHGPLRFSANRKQNLEQAIKARAIGKHINKVDDIGSQIFAIAFLFIGYFTSAFALLLLSVGMVYIISVFDEYYPPMVNILIPLTVLLIVLMKIYFIDLIFNGCISRISSSNFNRPYRHFERLMRYLSLYFIYEKLALTVRRGTNANHIGLLITVFIVLWVSFQVYSLHTLTFKELNHIPIHTKQGSLSIIDLSQHSDLTYLNTPAIEKTRFDSLPVKLFIPLNHSFTRAFEKACLAQDEEKVTLACIEKQFTISIGEMTLKPLLGFEYFKKVENNVIAVYVKPTSLAEGKHTLTLDINFLEAQLKADFWYFKD
jgi:hypothetical protein